LVIFLVISLVIPLVIPLVPYFSPVSPWLREKPENPSRTKSYDRRILCGKDDKKIEAAEKGR